MSSEPAAPQAERSLLVVGAGLLGTSVGLAVKDNGWQVWLTDADPRSEALAADLGAGARGLPDQAPDVVLVAVPPAATAEVVRGMHQLFPKSTLSDVASVKSQVQAELQFSDTPGTSPVVLSCFVGGHPLAGRERSGPEAARADLFEGQPWVLSPGPEVETWRVDLVSALVEAAGGLPVVQSASDHDTAVALVSHVPQLVASLLAARLVDAPEDALALAGGGLRDTTRIASSDAGLWTQILRANAVPVTAVLDRLAADLDQVRRALATIGAIDDRAISRQVEVSPHDGTPDAAALAAGLAAIRSVLEAGNAGRNRIPGKHGGRAQPYAVVPVVIPDEPASLARLFAAAGESGVNVEDVAIEHSPGQPVGLVELSVEPDRVDDLTVALRERGWLVH